MKKIFLLFVFSILFVSYSYALCNVFNENNYKRISEISNKWSFIFKAVEKDGTYSLYKDFNPIFNYYLISDIKYKNGNLLFKFKKNWLYYINYNGRRYWWYDRIYSLELSSMWKFIAKVKKDNNYYLVYNGRKYGPYQDIYIFSFSDNWKHFAYSAKTNGLFYVFVDGIKKWRWYNYISSINVDNNGNYVFSAKLWKNYIVNLNWHEKNYENVVFSTYSENKNHFMYKVKKDEKFFVVYDWKEWKLYDNIWFMKFALWWKIFSYAAWKWLNWALVNNNWEHKFYANVFLPKYSKDWKNYIYLVRENDKYKIIYNDKESPYYDKVTFYSIYKNHYAYWTNNWIILDWKKIKTNWKVNKIYFYENNYAFIDFDWKNYIVNFNWKKVYSTTSFVTNILLSANAVYFVSENNLYKNSEKIGSFDTITKLYLYKNNIVVYGKKEGVRWLYFPENNIFCNFTYLNNYLEKRYEKLIIKFLWKKIKKASKVKKLRIVKKIDYLIPKIRKTSKYNIHKKIIKITLYTAFKKLLLKY